PTSATMKFRPPPCKRRSANSWRTFDAAVERERSMIRRHVRIPLTLIVAICGCSRIAPAPAPVPPVSAFWHTGDIWGVSFSPDGRWIATAGADHSIRLTHAESIAEKRILRAHEGQVLAVVFSPDGSLLASACEDKTARLWDVATGREK